jgi:hypothetical protein
MRALSQSHRQGNVYSRRGLIFSQSRIERKWPESGKGRDIVFQLHSTHKYEPAASPVCRLPRDLWAGVRRICVDQLTIFVHWQWSQDDLLPNRRAPIGPSRPKLSRVSIPFLAVSDTFYPPVSFPKKRRKPYQYDRIDTDTD